MKACWLAFLGWTWTSVTAVVLRGATESGLAAFSDEVIGQKRNQTLTAALESALRAELLEALDDEWNAEGLGEQENWGYTPAGIAIPELALHELEPSATERIPEKDTISMMTGSTLSAKFNRCAIVGSSSGLAKTSFGDEIDSHETVVRINRLPSMAFAPFVGHKTTILFTGPVSHHRSRFGPKGFEAQGLNRGKAFEVLCPYNATTEFCSFQDLVFHSGLLRIGRRWRDVYPVNFPGWAPNSSKYNIAYQSTKILGAVRALEKHVLKYDYEASADPMRGTSGLNALFTFAPLCNEVDMYGFGGNDTVDAHRSIGVHSLHKEHGFMKRLGDSDLCKSVDEDCAMVNRSSRAEVAGCHMLRKVGCRLSQMAITGRLRFRGHAEHTWGDAGRAVV